MTQVSKPLSSDIFSFVHSHALTLMKKKLAVLVQGPYLVRSASISHSTLALTGDIDNSTEPLTIFAPSTISTVTWNGNKIDLASKDGNLFTAQVHGPKAFALPSLGSWKWHDSLPEIQANYTTSATTWISAYPLFFF